MRGRGDTIIRGAALICGALLFAAGCTADTSSAVSSTAPSTSPSTTSSSPQPPAPEPLGLAIVGLDGTVRRDLHLPTDAWMGDLSPDGSRVMFLTESTAVGFCGGCSPEFPRDRLAVVDVGKKKGGFVYVDGWTHGISQPVWAPGGDQIAFTAIRDKGNRDIFVATLKRPLGAYNEVRARRLTDDPADDEFPAWSADGSTIFYDNVGELGPNRSGFSYTQEIWSVPADGGAPTRLTYNSSPDAQPDVSSDGTVVFWRQERIWTMDQDGSDQHRLSAVPANTGFNPRWSPDGTMLALLRYGDPGKPTFTTWPLRLADPPLLQVVVVKLATGRVIRVGPSVASDVNHVSWTPDGSALLVDRYDSGA